MDTFVYNYHPVTKQYLGKSIADISPLDDEILVPANATLEAAPSVVDNKVPAFINDAWLLVEDRLGQSVWLPDGTEIEIVSLDQDIPTDALDEEPDLRTLDAVKAEAISTVNFKHAEFLRQLTGNATIEERDTWQAKALAAEAVLAGSASEIQTKMLATEAGLVGETTDALAQKIATKYAAYQKLIGLASGLRRKTENALEAAPNADAVDQVLVEADAQAKQFVQQWQSETA